MVKLLIKNEDGLPEIFFSDRIYVDPNAPTDILIIENSALFRIRISFTDVEESDSFMNILFEGDKINLLEIAETNPGLAITIEDEDDIDADAIMDVINSALEQYESNSEYDDPEYGEYYSGGTKDE